MLQVNLNKRLASISTYFKSLPLFPSASEANAGEVIRPKFRFSRGIWLGVIFSFSFLIGILSNNFSQKSSLESQILTPSATQSPSNTTNSNIYFSKRMGVKFNIPQNYRLSDEILDPSTDGDKKHIIVILQKGDDTITIEKNPIEKTPAKEIDEKKILIAGLEATQVTRLFTYAGAVINPNTYGNLTFEQAGSVQSLINIQLDDQVWSIFGPVMSQEAKDRFLEYQEELLKMVQSFEFLD